MFSFWLGEAFTIEVSVLVVIIRAVVLQKMNQHCHESPYFLSLFSDGTLLAVGSHDNFIYLYTVSDNGRKYSRYGKCSVSLLLMRMHVCVFLTL